MDKSPEAFRTISEVSDLIETPAHVLRFWESRFPQIRPVKRAGGRRYYRPGDVALIAGIRKLLHDDGMTIRGVQKILRERGVRHVAGLADLDGSTDRPAQAATGEPQGSPLLAAAPAAAPQSSAAPQPAAVPQPADAPIFPPVPAPEPAAATVIAFPQSGGFASGPKPGQIDANPADLAQTVGLIQAMRGRLPSALVHATAPPSEQAGDTASPGIAPAIEENATPAPQTTLPSPEAAEPELSSSATALIDRIEQQIGARLEGLILDAITESLGFGPEDQTDEAVAAAEAADKAVMGHSVTGYSIAPDESQDEQADVDSAENLFTDDLDAAEWLQSGEAGALPASLPITPPVTPAVTLPVTLPAPSLRLAARLRALPQLAPLRDQAGLAELYQRLAALRARLAAAELAADL